MITQLHDSSPTSDKHCTALVRWPPMGRKKYMLEGTQRGRNELIQDSIYRDTGIRRDRKQVSSHLQVLKDKLRGVPAGECPSRTSCNDRHQPLLIRLWHPGGGPACVDPVSSHQSIPIFQSSSRRQWRWLRGCYSWCDWEGSARDYQNETNLRDSPTLHGHTRGRL